MLTVRRCVLGAAVLVLVAGTAAAGSTPATQPAYTVAAEASSVATDRHRPVASADLLQPDATPATARAAIADYADRIPAGTALMYIKVQHAPDSARYVCRARWYADAEAFALYGQGRQPDTWPALATNCP